ncbi:unnamed protein product, partial [Phaeothamnion confervicola]
RELRLWVVGASQLRRASGFGRPDPYAVVTWDGREVGRTAVARSASDPCWYVRHSGGGGHSGSGSGDGGEMGFVLDAPGTRNPTLRVEIFDWEAIGPHGFLGGVELTQDQLAALRRETSRKARAVTTGAALDQRSLCLQFELRPRQHGGAPLRATIGLSLGLDREAESRRGRQRRREGSEVAAAAATAVAAAAVAAAVATAPTEAAVVRVVGQEESDEGDGALPIPINSGGGQWKEYYDEIATASYWYNAATGESQWECPDELTASQPRPETAGAVITEEAAAASQALQLMWSEADQAFYWLNSVTGEASWERSADASGAAA